MSTTATFTPPPSAIPVPSRNTDVFDFLHTPERELTPEDRISVHEDEEHHLVAITIETPDGRCLSRKVPAESWKEKSYRRSLIRSMCTLVA